ncbi:MAG: hypothetical protein KTR32_42075 [Granulosicoccus sp.]|nr:hypothetical protein [Granulosicoccus sp.]
MPAQDNFSPLVGAPLGPTMLRLAVPAVIGSLIFSSLSLVEAAFLTDIGTDALAAVAVVFPIVMLAAMFSAGAIGGAVSGFTARALGAGNHQQAQAVLAAAVVIAIFGGALMALLVLHFGPVLYKRATETTTIFTAAVTYALYVFPAMPAFWLVNMLCSVMRGTGDMVRPAIVAAVMLISYALFGWWLIPAQYADVIEAVKMAALAMVYAYFVSLGVALWYMLRPSQPVKFSFSALRWETLKGILKQGLLASSQSLMTVCYALVTTVLFSRYGTDWLAGFGLAVRLELIMVPIIFGMGSSLIAIVGAYVGAGQRANAISIAWKRIFLNAVIVGLIGLLFALLPGIWCQPLGSNAAVVNHCSTSISIIGPTYAFFALGLGCYFASQGLNTLLMPVLGAMIRLGIVALGLLWITRDTPPLLSLLVVAAAVVSYGLFVVVGLYLGPWKTKSTVKPHE